MSLSILPIELVSRIISSLQRPHQVRAVCRQWNSLAIKHAFHTATLVPTEAGCRKWNAIMDTSQLKTAIRTVVIYSHDPDTVEHNGFDWCEDEEDDNYTPFKEAVSRIKELDLVSKVSIRFSEESYGAQGGYCEVETKEAREKTIITVFEAIKTRAEEKPDESTIHALSLKNLQNFPLPDFTTSELFKAVTKDIDELHLDIKEEHNSHGPDHDIYLPELVEFTPYLQEHWLAPFPDNSPPCLCTSRNFGAPCLEPFMVMAWTSHAYKPSIWANSLSRITTTWTGSCGRRISRLYASRDASFVLTFAQSRTR
ncbi:hypothetical protein V2G26_012336 [Clonostachys chloroleuca]